MGITIGNIGEGSYELTAGTFGDIISDSLLYDPQILDAIIPAFNSGYSDVLTASRQKSSIQGSEYYWQELGREGQRYTAVAWNATAKTLTWDGGSSSVTTLLQVDDVVTIYDKTNGTSSQAIVTVVDATMKIVTVVLRAGLADGTVATGDISVVYQYNDKLQGSAPMKGLSAVPKQRHAATFITRKDFDVTGTDMQKAIRYEVNGMKKWFMVDWLLSQRAHTTAINMGLIAGVTDATNTQQGRHEGLLQGIKNGGITQTGGFSSLSDLDAYIDAINAQGGEMHNRVYGSNGLIRGLDGLISDATKPATGGGNFGSFANSDDMKVNLGFKSVVRSGYTFDFKSEKVLNDLNLLGDIGNVTGWCEPVGFANILEGGVKQSVDYVRILQSGDRYMKAAKFGYAENGVDAENFSLVSEVAINTVAKNKFGLFTA